MQYFVDWTLRAWILTALAFLAFQIDMASGPTERFERATVYAGSVLGGTNPSAEVARPSRNGTFNPETRHLLRPEPAGGIAPKLVSVEVPAAVKSGQAGADFEAALGRNEPAQAGIGGIPAQIGGSATAHGFKGATAVAVPRVPASAKWERVLQVGPEHLEHLGGDHCIDGVPSTQTKGCNAPRRQKWKDLVVRLEGLGERERLAAANDEINSLVKYSSDQEIYRENDHWATLEEAIELGWGDCEDIAIVKMWALHAAGIELEKMRLIVLRDTRLNVDHAVLSVEIGNGAYILDNVNSAIESADRLDHYRPIYALSVSGTWIYGFRNAPQQTAGLAQDTETVRQAL